MSAQVNLHDAKTHLSRLVEQAARGQSFVIAKAGRPMVRVTAVKEPGAQRSLGFLARHAVVSMDVKADFEQDMLEQFELRDSGNVSSVGPSKPPARVQTKPRQ